MGDACFSKQLIDEDGVFNVTGLESFINEVNLNDCGLSYVAVSIMGPQSSGKSTLLNHLFGTNFKQMDYSGVRKQTTQGIWLGKAQNIEPCTLVMDLEGTDGGERADDTTFEKQSALFALVVSDILLINMWCHDIGRQQAANKPLLNTVFQVMLKLFSPRKITMLFVIRDKPSKTPLENLEPTLREDIQKIWDGVPKPQDRIDTPLSYFFNVEVVALSSYEEREEMFKEQVSSLRDRFQHSITPGGLAGDRRVVRASGFSFSTQHCWKVIKEDKDLDLPNLNVMIARVRCVEISNEKFASFRYNEEWLHFEVQSDYVPGFGKKISSLLDECLSGYDKEAIYFHEDERASKRQDLESQLWQLITPAYKSLMGHLRTRTLEAFKESFDNALGNERFAVAARDCIQPFLEKFDRGSEDDIIQQLGWDPAALKDSLKHDIDAHVMSVRATKLSCVSDRHKANLARALAEPVKSHLHSPSNNTWRDIRELLVRETTYAVAGFESDLSEFELDESSKAEQVSKLKNYGNSVVESWAREEAATVLIRMKQRFVILFNLDAHLMPRVWTTEEEITNITKTAHSECLKMLCILAEILLDEDGDNIQRNLSGTTVTIFDPLASSSRQKIPRRRTLISRNRCESMWTQFKDETNHIVFRAMAIVAAQRRKAEERREAEDRREAEERKRKMLILGVVVAAKLVCVASGVGIYAVLL